MAVAAAHTLGIAATAAAAAIGGITAVAGRYATHRVGGHTVRLMPAKNPAGWAATLDMICGASTPVIICVNAAEADGRDTSWLYDVEFDRLAGRHT